jgi:GT2 family glycosyltransferase
LVEKKRATPGNDRTWNGPPKYSIIIVNYNGGDLILKCLESVFQHTSNFELILVDNGSTDGSSRTASDHFPRIILLVNEGNLGFATANNLGVSKARGEWIVLLNPDTIVTHSWLETMVKSAESSTEVGIVTPKLLRPDGRTIDSTGHVFNFRTGYSSDRGNGEPDVGQYDDEEEVPSCCFACAAIRRSVFDRIGSLDEKMILYFEDVDYCIRTRIAGWKVLYCPRSVVLHVRGGVSPKKSTPWGKRAVAYRLRIMLKCYSARSVLKYATMRIVRDFVSMAAGIKNNDTDYFLTYFRSPTWNLMNLPCYERGLVQSTRMVPDGRLLNPQ